MNRRSNTSTVLEDENTFSENVVGYEEPISTFDSEIDPDLDFEELSNLGADPDFDFAELFDLEVDENIELEEGAIWEESEVPDLDILKIQVFDVAAYILEKMGTVTTMKLQKLVYYSQAWSLVWDEKPLFEEEIEAWANGPVVRELFDYHRGMYEISSMPYGNFHLLNEEQRETVDAVLEYYGHRSAQWLIELTHMENPWKQARKGLTSLERGNQVISLGAMADYYSSLLAEEDLTDEEEKSSSRG